MALQGLEEKFDKAIGIMRWLGQCAAVVAGDNHAMTWHTPLGFPVMQPYRERVRVPSLTLTNLSTYFYFYSLPPLTRKLSSVTPVNPTRSILR